MNYWQMFECLQHGFVGSAVRASGERERRGLSAETLRRWRQRGRLCRELRLHWSGRVPLKRAFWINGVGVSLLLFAWTVAVNKLGDDWSYSQGRVVAWSVAGISAAVGVWQWRGIWRASARRSVHALARILAKLGVLVAACHVAGELLELGTYRDEPVIYGHYEVRLLGNAHEAEFFGYFSDGSAEALEAFMARNLQVRTLHLKSDGGLVREAAHAARLVQKRQLRVLVDSSCLSACVIVLLASEERVMRPEAYLGFHSAAAFGPGLSERQRRLSLRDKVMEDALVAVNASADFISQVHHTAADDMWVPSVAELRREHIVNHIAGPEEFVYCPPVDDDPSARDYLKPDPSMAALAEVDAKRFAGVVHALLASRTRGLTLKEFQSTLHAAAEHVNGRARCHPALSVVQSFARYQHQLIQETAKRFPDRCAKIMRGQADLHDVALGERLEEDWFSVEKSFFVEGWRAPSSTPSADQIEAADVALRAKLSAEGLKTLTDFKEGKAPPPASLCPAVVEYFGALATLPPEDIVALTRTKCEGD